MTTKDNYQLLIEKLDQFIRKYYVNQLIRGGLYSLALLLVLFLGLNFLEYHFYFAPGVREGLFWSFVGVSAVALFAWVWTPVFHYFKLGKIISHEQAARIVGEHFSGVKDKLLNVLQLNSQADTAISRELILASINQKSEEIRPVPFRNAIDLGQNRKYLRYTLPPLLLLIILLFAAPSLITDSTARLIKYNKEFEKPAPFHFILEEDLKVVQYGEFPLTVRVEGEVLPDEAFINVDNIQYRLTKTGAGVFSYHFSNVQKNTEFNFFSSGITSRNYTLEVLKKPNITSFDVKLDFPGYTGRKDEELKSIGDLVVPAGTNINWVFSAENTGDISLRFGNEQDLVQAKRFSDELFTFKKRALKDEAYRLFISNENLPNADSVSYSITVIPDLYPSINAEEFRDSTNTKLLYFVGDASDDYGLLSLAFHYRIKRNGHEGTLQTIKLKKPEGKAIQYHHIFDLSELALKPGDEVTYYFEAFDNDGVNGSKSSRTTLMVYSMPTLEEFEDMAEQNNQAIKDKLKDALKESKKVQEDMKKLHDKVLQQNDMDWQTRKELEKLLDRQKELEKQIDEAKQALDENQKNQEEYSQPEQSMQDKQEQLQDLMKDVVSDEMKDLMKKIEDLLQEMDKDKALEMMKDMQSGDEQMQNELDRMLELFKQLEFEYLTQQTIDKLEELAKEQEKLAAETEKASEKDQAKTKDDEQKASSEKTDEKNASDKKDEKASEKQNGNKQDSQEGQQAKDEQQPKSQDDLEKKQEEINKKFEDIEKKMEDLEKKNEEMQNKKEFDDQKEEREDIKEDLNDSKKNIQQSQNQKASRKQKSASKKMKEMANNMSMQMQQQQMEQLELDMKALRQLLENIVTLSFSQEDLMNQFLPVEINTPRYVTLTKDQKKIQDDFKVVEDSLYALAKRVIQMEGFITDKAGDIKDNMRRSLDHLEERQKPQAGEQQQRAMKNLNDLALMLSEVMQQMQQQMSGMMAGSQMCSNPGGTGSQGQSPKDKISEGQQKLNEGMQKMKQGQENGNGGTSKEFAEMAARQAALRKALREKQKKLQEQGQGDKELEQIMDQMNKIETELVNKHLTNEMLKRQQGILNRLLEHERAERQQEYDTKRKSETAAQQERKLPPSLEEYIKKREAEIELFKTVSPSLKPYYKSLVEEYYKSLKGTE
ncbi:MAG: DUF4175 domain-containing protein [Saprospiraceae bacterium]|nr:MAG: DUF4175 domain-containing protein [Saprospiraceae bacterium]